MRGPEFFLQFLWDGINIQRHFGFAVKSGFNQAEPRTEKVAFPVSRDILRMGKRAPKQYVLFPDFRLPAAVGKHVNQTRKPGKRAREDRDSQGYKK